MTILNFPASPTVGDTYTENNVIYTWSGTFWAANNAQDLDARFVNVTGDTMTGNLTVPSINGGQLAGFRNQIQNGLFQVRQRGDTFTSPANVYTFDRWWMGNAAGRTVAFVNESQFMSAMRVTNNTTDNVFLRQGIEIPKGSAGDFVQGTTWTLSLWSDSAGWAGRNLGACAFRDSGKMDNSAGQSAQTETTFVATGETNGTYKRYALQITITTPPAATHEMFCIGLSLPSGGLRITGVQLEPGPVATPFEVRPVGTELALCQRYYQTVQVNRYDTWVYRGNGTVGLTPVLQLPVTMRATPTGSSKGSLALDGYTAFGVAPTPFTTNGTISLVGRTPGGYQLSQTGFTTNAQTSMVYVSTAGNVILTADAEL